MSLLTKRPAVPLLCYVTDSRGISSSQLREAAREGDPAHRSSAEARHVLLNKIAAAAAAGLDWIEIREKQLSAKECICLVRDALQGVDQQRTRESAAWPRAGGQPIAARIIVNDRLDIALAAEAGGVHLGENSLPPGEAQRLVRDRGREHDFLVGASCHSLEAAKTAEKGGADYIFFGPVFATPSKAAYGPPQGLARLSEACRAVSIPVLAIGGISLENFSSCLSAGASGIAAIRLFQDAEPLSAVSRALGRSAP